jgi:hypothetical protein
VGGSSWRFDGLPESGRLAQPLEVITSSPMDDEMSRNNQPINCSYFHHAVIYIQIEKRIKIE